MSDKNKQKKNTPHDGLIKRLMENPIAAREFLEEYVPINFKSILNLSTVKIEKESFVEESLAKQMSDIVLSVKTINNEDAYVYALIEGQVKSDYWMAFRLWKYIMLLLERHKNQNNKDKLPLICPIVWYYGSKKFTAPRNMWDLFTDPILAKELLANDYNLVDLHSMKDEEIDYNKHLSMILYMMKHVHMRDKLKLIEDIFKNCQKAILIDKQNDYIYTKLMIWYTDSKVPANKKESLEKMIIDNLPNDDKGNIMRTIADVYREEGISIGEQRGISIGEQRGISIGEQRGISIGVEKTALNMLKTKTDVNFISSVTGLSIRQLLELKSKI